MYCGNRIKLRVTNWKVLSKLIYHRISQNCNLHNLNLYNVEIYNKKLSAIINITLFIYLWLMVYNLNLCCTRFTKLLINTIKCVEICIFTFIFPDSRWPIQWKYLNWKHALKIDKRMNKISAKQKQHISPERSPTTS